MCQVVDMFGFVHVYITLRYDFRKCLYADGVFHVAYLLDNSVFKDKQHEVKLKIKKRGTKHHAIGQSRKGVALAKQVINCGYGREAAHR